MKILARRQLANFPSGGRELAVLTLVGDRAREVFQRNSRQTAARRIASHVSQPVHIAPSGTSILAPISLFRVTQRFFADPSSVPLLERSEHSPRSIAIGSSVAPAATTADSTRARASGSISNVTQPPPPAPQTFPASAPWRRAEEITLSISGVEMERRLRRRNPPFFGASGAQLLSIYSARSPRACACAISEIFSRFCATRRVPSMCRLKTSQLLMPCCRGFPV